MDGESGLTRSIIDDFQSADIQGVQMEGESGVSPNIIDELYSSDMQKVKWKLKVVLLEVSLMNLLLRIRSNGRRK